MQIHVRTNVERARTYSFDVPESTTIEELKEMLRQKLATKPEKNYFSKTVLSFDGEVLSNERKTLTSHGIKNEDNLDLHDLNIRSKNFSEIGFQFIDPGKTKAGSEVQWADTAPRWRIAGRGLCLEGMCKNSNCEAFDQQVIMSIGYERFDFGHDIGDTTTFCPMCKEYVDPVTCGFNNCWWRYEGKRRAENGAPKRYSSDWMKVGNYYYYFDQKDSPPKTWMSMVLEAVKKNPL